MAPHDQIQFAVCVEIAEVHYGAIRQTVQIHRNTVCVCDRERHRAFQTAAAGIAPKNDIAPIDSAEQIHQAVSIEIVHARIELIRPRKKCRARAEVRLRRRASVEEKLDVPAERAGHQVWFAVAIPIAQVKAPVRTDKNRPVRVPHIDRCRIDGRGVRRCRVTVHAKPFRGIIQYQIKDAVARHVRQGDG